MLRYQNIIANLSITVICFHVILCITIILYFWNWHEILCNIGKKQHFIVHICSVNTIFVQYFPISSQIFLILSQYLINSGISLEVFSMNAILAKYGAQYGKYWFITTVDYTRINFVLNSFTLKDAKYYLFYNFFNIR